MKFKKRNAHAIPDALGNKLVFCNDECKNCNSSLSTIDKELTEYLKFRRADFKIANKNNKIIQVWGHNFFYNGPTGELKISRLAILKEIDNSFYVKLEGADPITHLGIYKALAKIAIDLMPRNMVDDFHTTIDWIKGDFIPKSLPNIFFAYCKAYVSQPKVTVFMLKDCVLDDKLPKCIVALALTDLIFFYIVPFGKGDVIYKGDFLKRYVPSIIERIQAVEKVRHRLY